MSDLQFPTCATLRIGYPASITLEAEAAPIFHLSFTVNDLDGALAFYSTLGGIVGRRETGWVDVVLCGAQLTLQHVPEDVLEPVPR